MQFKLLLTDAAFFYDSWDQKLIFSVQSQLHMLVRWAEEFYDEGIKNEVKMSPGALLGYEDKSYLKIIRPMFKCSVEWNIVPCLQRRQGLTKGRSVHQPGGWRPDELSVNTSTVSTHVLTCASDAAWHLHNTK